MVAVTTVIRRRFPGPNGVSVLDTTKLLAGHRENSPVPSWSGEEIQRKGVAASTNGSATAWAGPWGVSFAINLSPDNATGIGEWSESNFIQMARTENIRANPMDGILFRPCRGST